MSTKKESCVAVVPDEWGAMINTAPSLVGKSVRRSHLKSTLEMLNYVLIKMFDVASTKRLLAEITSNANIHVAFSVHMTAFIKERGWNIETAGKMLSILRKILRGTELCETFIKGICINRESGIVKKDIKKASSLGAVLEAFGEKVTQHTKIKSPSSLRNVLFFYARIFKAADIDLANWPEDAESKLKKTLTQEFMVQMTSGKMRSTKSCWLNLLLSKILKVSFEVDIPTTKSFPGATEIGATVIVQEKENRSSRNVFSVDDQNRDNEPGVENEQAITDATNDDEKGKDDPGYGAPGYDSNTANSESESEINVGESDEDHP